MSWMQGSANPLIFILQGHSETQKVGEGMYA